jgi:hypothetical protein
MRWPAVAEPLIARMMGDPTISLAKTQSFPPRQRRRFRELQSLGLHVAKQLPDAVRVGSRQHLGELLLDECRGCPELPLPCDRTFLANSSRSRGPPPPPAP